MLTRSTRSMMTFPDPISVGAFEDEIPPGEYEVVVEEELLQGLSFKAYRRTAIYLMVRGRGIHAGRTSMHMITQEDLEQAIACDQSFSEAT